ncbi:DotA/TraY family protein [Candidatus Berkiella cookevillensis]|uniref:DotA/TraY family protein n=1 Tax=Candidatus Berkiella cookevillensis TaxID=437022 RepID=A0A0Q9YTV5_9GAMM|nr:DotA/TraY family protein [Candidatus Berkiella cookevillensis]MCS5708335.1 DotA/TraY family protein [Candidatus Berkiella cookevillensis]
MRFRWFLLLIVLFIPVTSFATSSGGFSVDPADKSMQYLASIFGSIPALPIQAPPDDGSATTSVSRVFQPLVHKFNIVVFALGIIIIIYTTLVGTLSTAQEGEVLGKKWSSIWIPARIGMGMYLLLPAAGSGGYSYVQIAILWMIVQGVGAANAVWKEVVLDPNSIHDDTREARLANAKPVILGLLKSALCMEKLNKMAIDDPSFMIVLGENIDVYTNENMTATEVGRPGSAGLEKPICGKFVKNSYKNLGSDEDTAKNIIHSAISNAFWTVDLAAYEAINTPKEEWFNFDQLVAAASTLSNAMTSLKQTVSLDSTKELAIQNGWIHAGSYYFKIIEATGGSESAVTIEPNDPNTDELAQLFGGDERAANTFLTEIGSLADDYLEKASDNLEPVDAGDRHTGDLGFQTKTSSLSGDAVKALDAVFGSFFKDIAVKIGEYMHNNSTDPIVSISRFGSDVVVIVEAIFWGSLVAIFLVWLLTSIMCCMQPLCNAMNFLIGVIIPLAGLAISIAWVEGIIMALYIPMIPYLVFTFAAITWVILVIEALLAAPLIGLSLVMPSEDELGKATTGIVILFGLFMRPVLMIVGFIFSVKLILVAFTMISFGFGATLQYSVQLGIGLFGCIAVLFLYMGIATAVVHECFSLIYKVPDKTLAWINAGGGGHDEGSKVKALRGSTEAGAKVGQKAMSGLLGAAGSLSKSTGGGGKGGGGGMKL